MDFTTFELHCVDAAGETVKEDHVVFPFMWEGIVVAIAVILMALLALLLAAPAGMFASRLLRSRHRSPS
jgi:hypothetical protein